MNTSTLTAFYAIADIAATKWYLAKCCYVRRTWAQAADERKRRDGAMTFRAPNFDHPRGYIAFLFTIANVEGGIKRAELAKLFNIRSVSLMTDTLEYAGLISLDREYTHKFTITPFGRAYLALAELARPNLKALKDAKQTLKAAATL